MKKTNTSFINQSWPNNELEHLNACPYCNSKNGALVYKDVQDWSFYCAPGKWAYWECKDCEALYLNPRPTEETISNAYRSYYTHNVDQKYWVHKIQIKLKNECLSHWLNINVLPRLGIPSALSFLLKPLRRLLVIPFELDQLALLPKGKLLDVGCGSGNMLTLAKELGWTVTGLEIDPNAVDAAMKKGLDIIHGDYRKLEHLVNEYDCIVCSHVLEHVHNPLGLMELLIKSLKPNGILFLSLPNSNSHVRKEFGINWRGLEAPRHITIPAIKKVIEYLNYLGCVKIDQYPIYGNTVADSVAIKNKAVSVGPFQLIYFKLKNSFIKKPPQESDFIRLVAKKE